MHNHTKMFGTNFQDPHPKPLILTLPPIGSDMRLHLLINGWELTFLSIFGKCRKNIS